MANNSAGTKLGAAPATEDLTEGLGALVGAGRYRAASEPRVAVLKDVGGSVQAVVSVRPVLRVVFHAP